MSMLIMSHHVQTWNDGQKDRTTNLLISSNVHYHYLSGNNEGFNSMKLYECNRSCVMLFLGEAAMWRAQMYGNTELYRQAKNLAMPSCDRLRNLNIGF